MPSPQTTSGKRSKRLSELARHVVVPTGIETTAWPSVRDKCRLLGIEFDRWQDGAGRAMLAKRDDGVYAASIGGCVLSIPRQVGKTFLVGAIAFALCLIHPGLKVIWTAHHSNTSDETFESMQQLAGRSKVRPHVRKILTGGGKQDIIFKNGSRVEFGAREHGFGRGKTKVGLLVLDEAQILTEKAMENLVPTLNSAPNPLMFLMGTPPRAIDPGSVFLNRREKALGGESEDTLYIEFSADVDAKVTDKAQWRKANPSYPSRTPESAILRMLEALGDDSFRREALGIWDQSTQVQPEISVDDWSDRLGVPVEGRSVAGVKFSIDGALVALSVATRAEDGPVFVEPIRVASTGEGTQWLVEWMERNREDLSQIVVDGKAGAQAFINDLIDAGFNPRAKVKRPESRFIRVPSTDEVVTAHQMFLSAVRQGGLSHDGSELLATQVAGAVRRRIGSQGGWAWQGLGEADDVTLLDSATFAFWGARTTKRRTGVRQEVSI